MPRPASRLTDARGSNQYIGPWNVFVTHILHQTGPDRWLIADGDCRARAARGRQPLAGTRDVRPRRAGRPALNGADVRAGGWKPTFPASV